ncbi:MAG: hypothetical protein PVJ76_20965, partial [Gemmatimonadota bacterium]
MRLHPSSRPSLAAVLLPLAFLGIHLLTPGAGSAQEARGVRVQMPGGFLEPELALEFQHGFPAVSATELLRLGWTVTETADGIVARWKGGVPAVEIEAGNPFLSWGGEGVQVAEAPYRDSENFFLPLQVVIDIFP